MGVVNGQKAAAKQKLLSIVATRFVGLSHVYIGDEY